MDPEMDSQGSSGMGSVSTISAGRWLRRGFALVVAFAIVSVGFVDVRIASAEIFKWKDEAGRLHFAQDLNQVPARFRAQARGEAIVEGEQGVIQRYAPAPASIGVTRKRSRAAARNKGGEAVYRIRVQKTANSMRVNVRLNDRVTAPFYIDTGASDVSLPEWVAKELGLDLEGARTAYYSTANGVVESALVTLDSVELGGARAENIPAHVSKTMSTGLLGLAFFNHFRYRFDPVAGIVTLRPNGLAEEGKIRAGRSADQWRAEFSRLAYRRAAMEEALESTSPNRSRRRAELRDEIAEVDRQYRMLEGEADDARVPMQWRD